MEKIGAAFFLCGCLSWSGLADAQTTNANLASGPASHAQVAALLYNEVPDFSFASARLQVHSLHDLGVKYRKLLLFAPSAQDEFFKQQIRLLAAPAAQAGMRERDMVLISVLQSGSFAADAAPEAPAAAKIAEAYGVPPGSFAALLIGRTNVLKSWSDKPFAPDFLFQLIDSLPMRRHEMQAAAQ